jgi:hypothetical protein
MDEADRAADRIDEKGCAAIGHVNTETNAALIRDQPIASIETFVARHGCIDHANFLSVDLLRGDERDRPKTMFMADRAVNSVQPRQSFRLVVRHLEAGDAEGEPVDDARQPAERRKLFSPRLSVAHFGDVVVRVVVVVVLVWIGGRLPA